MRVKLMTLSSTMALAALSLLGPVNRRAYAQQVIADGTTQVASGTINTGTMTPPAGYALYALNGGTIQSFSPLTVVTGGLSSDGVVAMSGGSITLFNGSSVRTTQQDAIGLIATGTDSSITADNVTILATNFGGYGAAADNGASVTLNGGNITSVNSALRVRAGGTIRATDVDATATASNASGVLADNGTIYLTGGSVTSTIGASDHGLVASNGAAIHADGVSIEATGNGLNVGSSSLITFQNGTINSAGFGVRAFSGGAATLSNSSIDAQSAGMSVDGPGSGSMVPMASVVASGMNVHTTGDAAYGAFANSGGLISSSASSIATFGNGAFGLYATDAGSQITSTGDQIQTGGSSVNQGSHGAYAANGGQIWLNVDPASRMATGDSGAILTLDAQSNGLQAFGQGSSVGAANETVTTRGLQSIGAVALSGGEIALDAGAISTTGQSAAGVAAVDGGVVTMSGPVTLHIEGAGSDGMVAMGNGSTVQGPALVSTSGATAEGVVAGNGGSISLTSGSSVMTTGAGSHALVVGNGGTLSMTSSSATATGADASALFLTGPAGSRQAVNIADGTLSSAGAAAISIPGGTADVSLVRTSVVGNGTWLNVDDAADNPGVLHLIADSSQLTGAATEDSTSDVVLQNGTTWNLTGNSQVTNLANSASSILFSPPTAGAFRTLTVTNYIGANGVLGLNATLGADQSPADKMVVDGGTAIGGSRIQITNAGGQGALTTANGIAVVQAVNGGTTTSGAFALSGVVAAGPYQYQLVRGGVTPGTENDWFLRSNIDCSSPGAPSPPCPPPSPPNPPTPPGPPSPNPPTPPNPPSPPVPHYRPEVSLYTALPALALRYGLATLDNLHERVGDEEQLRDRSDLQSGDLFNGAWVRVMGESGDVDGDRRGIYGDGPHYDYSLLAFQFGLDVYAQEHESGQRDHVGLYVGDGRIVSDVTHFNDQAAGHDEVRGPSLGLYWTHFWQNGAYLDAVFQGTWAKATAHSVDALELDRDGFIRAASLEGGFPFHYGTQVFEPQAQWVYQTINSVQGSDVDATVRFRDMDSLAARAGLRWANTWTLEPDSRGIPRLFTGWLRLSLWHEFEGQPITEFSSAEGYVPFRADMQGSWWQLNAGVTWQLSRTTSFYANVGYQQGFGRSFDAWDGKLGLRWNW